VQLLANCHRIKIAEECNFIKAFNLFLFDLLYHNIKNKRLFVLKKLPLPLINSNTKFCHTADCGFPLEDRVLVPYKHQPNQELTPVQRNFNLQLSRTRIGAEQVNGVLKQCFRCLDKSGGQLLYDPDTVCEIFTACCMLHNIRLRNRVPLPEDLQEEQNNDVPLADVVAEDDLAVPDIGNMVHVRNALAQALAQNLH
jgi:hypothetical protein